MRKQSISLWLCAFLLMPAVLKADNSTAQEYTDMGMALYQKGAYAKAVQYFKTATQADPNDWSAYEDLGNAYMKINDNPSAMEAYQKSLQINPDNPTLRIMVENLQNTMGASGGINTAPANPSSVSQPPPASNQIDQEEPVKETIVVRHPKLQPRTVPQYNDSLAPIDHARMWTKLELGYSYSALTDLFTGADSINNQTYGNAASQLFGTPYAGSALASNSGLNLGFEVGFLIDPNEGIALGVRYIQTNDLTEDVSYTNSYGDYENATFSPYLVPFTLDYYFFVPDHNGRFFISAGLGYYAALVHVNETYSTANFYNQDNAASPINWAGDLTSGNIGFQVGIGREFAINNRFGITLFAKGRYAKIGNFRGTVYDNYGDSADVGLAIANSNGPVEIDAPQYINNANGERYATLDFTGFDVGFALNFYSF